MVVLKTCSQATWVEVAAESVLVAVACHSCCLNILGCKVQEHSEAYIQTECMRCSEGRMPIARSVLWTRGLQVHMEKAPRLV